MTVTTGSGRPFAVFDIDGTVIRWQLYHAIFGELAKTGHISPQSFNEIRTSRMTWKKRAHETSFKKYEQAIIKALDEAILNINYEDYLSAVATVFQEYKDQTYTYTRGLIRSLKNQGYLLFAISASQTEIVELLATYYEFDDYGGSVYRVKSGKFTGQKDVLKNERKPEYLQHLIKKHNAITHKSIAIGDSVSDIPMLETANNPIAFNPDKILFERAQKSGWKIVIERKNVIYKLEPRDGTFILA